MNNVEKIKLNGLFTNYIFKAIPLAFDESMSYYETLCAILEKLKQQEIIVNNNADVLIELENYVTHYFDNLDVQEEINNKLDEMVEQGTLQEIIADYLNSQAVFGYDTVNNMKQATNLINGSYAKTLGYYEKNDGGSATYKIRNITNDDVVDDMFLIAMNNQSLVAELIIENNTVNIKQLGARSQKIDGTKYDIKNYLQGYINKLDTIPNKIRLYIPSGIWHTSPITIARQNGFYIYGDNGLTVHNVDGTIISSYNDYQDYIINVGNNEVITRNWVLKNIVFTTAEFTYDSINNTFMFGTVKTINEQCVKFLYATFGESDNLFFLYINGQAMKIISCWENDNRYLNFRHIHAIDTSILCFGKTDISLGDASNISACNFRYIMFEQVDGNLMEFEDDCRVGNCNFDLINFEDSQLNGYDKEYTVFSDSTLENWNDETAVHFGIIKLNKNSIIRGVVINSINMNNVSYRYFTVNNINYVYDTIILNNEDDANYEFAINNIAITGMNKDMSIIRKPEDINAFYRSTLEIGTIVNNSLKNFIINAYALRDINVIGNLKQYQEPKDFLPNEFTPFYKTLFKQNTGRGLLYYDKDSLNKLNLCVSPQRSFDRRFARIIFKSNTIFLRAKVPNGETFTFTAIDPNVSTKHNNLAIQGTGNFENYTFELSNFDLGDLVQFVTSSGNTGSSCLLDYYTFI